MSDEYGTLDLRRGFTKQEEASIGTPKAPRRFRVTNRQALIIVLTLAIIATLIFPLVPRVSHAKDITPRKDYPLTNRGTCEMIHDHQMRTKGAPAEAFERLCRKEGIELKTIKS